MIRMNVRNINISQSPMEESGDNLEIGTNSVINVRKPRVM